MNVKCHFCQKLCRKVTTDKNSSLPYQTTWQCDYHNSVRVQHVIVDNLWTAVILVVQHREQTYHVIFNNAPKELKVDPFRIIKIHPQMKQTIVALDFHPEITPDNVQTKLPLYLLFS